MLVRKPLIEYTVGRIVRSGVPLTDRAIRDLLTTMDPEDIVGISSSEAILLDRVSPIQGVLSILAEDVRKYADYSIIIDGVKMTVANAISAGYPFDFVLACVAVPLSACRWYVLEYMSENPGYVWPTDIRGLKDIDTKFDLSYLMNQVNNYLELKTVDRNWIWLFGLEGVVEVAPDVAMTNRMLINALRMYLTTGNKEWESLLIVKDETTKKIVDTAGERLGTTYFAHLSEVYFVQQAHQDFINCLSEYCSSNEHISNILESIKSEVTTKELQ